MDEERCIYLILSKLSSAYSMFLSTFYAMKEAVGKAYVQSTLESFCTSLIREEDKLVQLGVINTAGMLRTKQQYSMENLRKSTQRLETEIISDNKPL
jgi:phosphopantetheinyl transferase (holo-ACP synthase)